MNAGRTGVATVALGVAVVASLRGQTAPSTFAKFDADPVLPAPMGSLPLLMHSDSVPRGVPPTQWLKGGIIGAVGLGVPGAILAHEFCVNDEIERDCLVATVGGTLLTGGLGFALGSLIGGLFPKQPDSASTLLP